MKLYLSSIGIPDAGALFGLLGKRDNVRAASIRTAWDPYLAEKREDAWPKYSDNMFASHNIIHKVVDLKDYQKDASGLHDELQKYDLIWMHGGNSFYLNYWAQQCDFGEALRILLRDGKVYGGESAGAVIVCPSLHGVEFADDISDAPEVIYEGLGLVDFAIVPHWGNEKFQSVLESVKAELEKFNPKVVTIGDNDCIVIDGSTEKILLA